MTTTPTLLRDETIRPASRGYAAVTNALTTRTYALPYESKLVARHQAAMLLAEAGLSVSPVMAARFTYGLEAEGGRDGEVWMTVTGVAAVHSTMLSAYPWTGR